MTTQAEREQALADRMSAALTEIGDASSALILGEREACALLMEDESDRIRSSMHSAMKVLDISNAALKATAFLEAAKLIRGRPK